MGAQRQSGFTLPCDFSDSGLNLPFSRVRTASVVPLSHTEGSTERSKEEEKGGLAKYRIERVKVTYLQVVQNKFVNLDLHFGEDTATEPKLGRQEGTCYARSVMPVSVMPDLLNSSVVSHLILRTMDFFMVSRRW